jgi:hypothetical protein
MAGYSTTPLPKKLGIRPEALVALVAPPPRFLELLEPLPAGARVVEGLPRGERFNVAIVFSPTAKQLKKGLDSAIKRMTDTSAIWIAWPKKASKVATDVDESLVRKTGLATGLVDNKVCAIDDTWSGLCFVVRVGDRKGHPKKTRGV